MSVCEPDGQLDDNSDCHCNGRGEWQHNRSQIFCHEFLDRLHKHLSEGRDHGHCKHDDAQWFKAALSDGVQIGVLIDRSFRRKEDYQGSIAPLSKVTLCIRSSYDSRSIAESTALASNDSEFDSRTTPILPARRMMLMTKLTLMATLKIW